MVLRCFLCKTTYNRNEKDVQMHKVPKKEHIMKLWLSVLNMEQINSNARLCSKHFTKEDFMISVVGERKYLKSDAVPSMYLQKNEKNTEYNSSKEENIQYTPINLQKDEENIGCSSSKEENIQYTPMNLLEDEENSGCSSSKEENIQYTPMNLLEDEENSGCSSSEEENIEYIPMNLQDDEENSGYSSSKEENIQYIPMNLQEDEENTGYSSSKEENIQYTSMNLQEDEENTGRSSSKEDTIQNTQNCNIKHTSLKRSLSTEQLAEEIPLKNIKRVTDINIKKISQSSLEAEACLEVLIEELHEEQKKVKHFRNKAGKLQKTVKDLRSLINTLKDNKLITSTARDTLKIS